MPNHNTKKLVGEIIMKFESFCQPIRKKSKLFLLISFFIILSVPTFAQKPDYVLNINILNKSAQIGDSVYYIVYLMGGGTCDDAYFNLNTEGTMQLNGTPEFTISINQTTPELLKFREEAQVSCVVDKQVYNYSVKNFENAGGINVPLSHDFKKGGYIELLTRGTIKSPKNSAAGDYDVNVIFSCLNNDTWYNFKDKQSFRLLLKGESDQFVTSKSLAWFAILISILALLMPEEYKKKIWNFMKKPN